MKKNLENVIKILIYSSFFIPLVVIPSSFIFPFIVPKILLFRSVTILMLGCYVLLLCINWQQYKPKFTSLNVVMVFFLLSFALSTFFGVDSYHSFWDNHERMLGLFTVVHYGLFYLICSSVFNNWSEWKTALKLFLIAGSAVMLIGLMQKIDPNFLMNQGSNRVSSTLGNAIYVGGYGLFLIFVSLLLFLKEKSLFWKILLFGLGVLAFLGMIFSGTRGSMLGLIVGIAFALLSIVILFYKSNLQVRKFTLPVAIILMLILAVLFFNRQSAFVAQIPVLGSLLNTSLDKGTANTRLIAWNIAVEGWKDRPVLGWGPNNFFYAFNKYYNPKSLEYGYGETWFDNAHNIILNTLTVQGLFGLLCYLSIFVVGVMILWQDTELRQKNTPLIIIGSAFLVAHLAQNVTVFENPTSYLYFMFWLAMINRLTYNSSLVVAENLPVPTDKKISGVLTGVVGVFSVVLIFIFNIQPARANMKTLDALNALYQDPVLSIVKIKEVLSFSSPHIDDIRSDIARTTLQVLGSGYQKIGIETSKELLEVVYSNLQKNLVLHPLDIRNHLGLAQFGQIGVEITRENKYILNSEQYLEQALVYSPRRQQLHYMLSLFKAQLGKLDEGVVLLEQSIQDDPKIGESYWRLAYIYAVSGNTTKAKEILNLAHTQGIVFDDQGKKIEALILTPASSVPDKTKK